MQVNYIEEESNMLKIYKVMQADNSGKITVAMYQSEDDARAHIKKVYETTTGLSHYYALYDETFGILTTFTIQMHEETDNAGKLLVEPELTSYLYIETDLVL
jgi:hypothetical protein